MKNKQIMGLYKSLSAVGNLSGVRFSYAVAKNLGKIKPEVEAMQKSISPMEDFTKFEKERVALAELHSEKDEKGKPVIEQDAYKIIDEEKFEKKLEKLRETHKKAIEAREKQIEDFNKMLEDETKVELHKIDIDDVPKEITAGQMTGIIAIIQGKEDK